MLLALTDQSPDLRDRSVPNALILTDDASVPASVTTFHPTNIQKRARNLRTSVLICKACSVGSAVSVAKRMAVRSLADLLPSSRPCFTQVDAAHGGVLLLQEEGGRAGRKSGLSAFVYGG